MKNTLSWVEISKTRLQNNVRELKKLLNDDCILAPVIKANAYGHGISECAPLVAEAGAGMICVSSLHEAQKVRASGVQLPIYILGYVRIHELETVVKEGFHLVVYNQETIEILSDVAKKTQKTPLVHLKLETGNYRQGVIREDLPKMLQLLQHYPEICLIGISTHFSNIEDTADHSYALYQLKQFQEMKTMVLAAGFQPKYIHCANTAATLVMNLTHFNMVRTGLGIYGLWPSEETREAVLKEGKVVDLQPVLTWKTLVAQVKFVPKGAFIGYGCTYQAPYDMKIAILPVGYYDGYRRSLSNTGSVLIRGKRAPVRGRVCMNVIMVEVTDVPGVSVEDEVVLLGEQLGEKITAEELATQMGTITWEVVTQIQESLERKIVD